MEVGRENSCRTTGGLPGPVSPEFLRSVILVVIGLMVIGQAASIVAASASSYMGDVTAECRALAYVVSEAVAEGKPLDENLEAVQSGVERLAEGARVVSALVIDGQGLIVASSVPEVVGRRVPIKLPERLPYGGWWPSWPKPEIIFRAAGDWTQLGRVLGLEGSPEDFSTVVENVWPEGPWPNDEASYHADSGQVGQPLAFVVAITRRPAFLGVNAWEWRGWLDFFNGLLFAAFTLALAGWVWTDARRSDMPNPPAWGLLTLVANVIGWATYLVLRNSQRVRCAECGSVLRSSYRACPHCGTQVGRGCPSCGAIVRDDWNFCPQCAAELN